MDRHLATAPIWLELSGLPGHLNQVAKKPFAWIVFRKIVELDMALHPHQPGLVEVSVAELAERTGLEPDKVPVAIKAARKAAVLRAFLPDNEEEPGLFEVLTPIPTPRSADEVRARHADLFLECPWPPRYATAVVRQEAGTPMDRTQKIKVVVDHYLNTFSMKMNSIILDELQIIADRYELDLIVKVFERARKREATSLGWVLTEIRRETKLQVAAQQAREAERKSSL